VQERRQQQCCTKEERSSTEKARRSHRHEADTQLEFAKGKNATWIVAAATSDQRAAGIIGDNAAQLDATHTVLAVLVPCAGARWGERGHTARLSRMLILQRLFAER
jgi:hypothetical protein